ncbi:MAG TPA: molybdopterin-dependent oxidoreductase [Pseudonocardiaceae bacterium]|jgi:DMSO/TMAO reductase YedYZ molybdopterin-dependent catalytic subunit|nr:molybdopterin-dependent oxidoreductase [Pseudonocardiaceae bacterium]
MRLPIKPPPLPKFRGAAHHRSVTSRVGVWLAVTFTVCFVTGLASHFIQHPVGWFNWPSRPVNLYRITQGVHVISGTAAVPLLLAKLWSVYPKLFERPAVRSVLHAIERISILVLIASAIFELVTGIFNVAQNYPWRFFFPAAHYAVAWIAVGSLVIHLAVKLPIVRAGLREKPSATTEEAGLSRRGFLRTTWLTAGVAGLAVAGGTVPFLRGISVLSPVSSNGPQQLPVNRTALAAGVRAAALDPRWRLTIVGPQGRRMFSLADLRAMPQSTAELPIACVEGWSASAVWSGVRVADLVRAVGARPGVSVFVESLEHNSLYATSTLPGTHTADPLTLLALRLNGSDLDLDHGFPCRIIAPSRPGVLQTKWVNTITVLS